MVHCQSRVADRFASSVELPGRNPNCVGGEDGVCNKMVQEQEPFVNNMFKDMDRGKWVYNQRLSL